jgi:hypothetical protein
MTRDEATRALAEAASYAPLPTYYPETMIHADIGRVYFLAGDLDHAFELLDRLSKGARGLFTPIPFTRALVTFGQTLERRGDVAGACAAYARVLARWGSAPKSITADAARARVRALKCAP